MSRKIILIEDDFALRELYKRILTKAGYSIVTADDGPKGLTAVQENTDADLILLDIMLPRMHGIDVLTNIKANEKTKNIPIVMLSNLAQEKIIEKAKQIGSEKYLVKVNTSPKELREQISKILDKTN